MQRDLLLLNEIIDAIERIIELAADVDPSSPEPDRDRIDANRVPAGFRRDGKAVIATPDTALRLPTDPDCSILVSCTDADVDAVRSAARATGFWSS